MADVDIYTVQDLITALDALPADQKALPVQMVVTVTVKQEVSKITLGPADFGQEIDLS